MKKRSIGIYRKYIKRLLDIFFSILALPILLVVFIIVAPIIVLEDKGPVFYNAPRLGKNGKVFTMYKFRSMKVNAPDLRNEDGTTYNAEDDPRVTRTGRWLRKTSIDELMQIINVLIGNMSFVGPRPDLPAAISAMTDYEKKKLTVLPGITGYSQACHRNLIEIHDRYQEDVYYAENVSFMLDVKIIVMTIKTVLLGTGVYRNEDGKKIIEKSQVNNDEDQRSPVGTKKP